MTDDEKNWLDAICMLGCIVCRNELLGRTPAEPHHLLRGGKRIDHFHTIPLCVSHHRAGICNGLFVSRHPYRREFERRYGTEQELLEQVRGLVKEQKP